MISKCKYSHKIQHMKNSYIYPLTSCICKKTNVEWFTPKTFITMLPWVFHATLLFQSIPAGLSVELLTSLWGRERAPEMHLSPPERGYWPKTKRWRNETLSEGSEEELSENWILLLKHIKLGTMTSYNDDHHEFPSRKTHREQNIFFHSLNEVGTPTLVYTYGFPQSKQNAHPSFIPFPTSLGIS